MYFLENVVSLLLALFARKRGLYFLYENKWLRRCLSYDLRQLATFSVFKVRIFRRIWFFRGLFFFKSRVRVQFLHDALSVRVEIIISQVGGFCKINFFSPFCKINFFSPFWSTVFSGLQCEALFVPMCKTVLSGIMGKIFWDFLVFKKPNFLFATSETKLDH